MNVLARFPAMPPATPADRPAPAPIEPPRPRPAPRPRPSPKLRAAKTFVPNRSILILALIAFGIWGMVLRDELVHRKPVSVDVAETASPSSHRLAREPGPAGTPETRVAE